MKRSPDIPYDFSFLISPSCQTLSKAFEMSQNIKIVDNRSSKFWHTLWYISNNWHTVQIEINNDLQILDQWAKTWLVDFNPKKNKALIISNNTNIPELNIRFNDESVVF
jgi:hypothetical protein